MLAESPVICALVLEPVRVALRVELVQPDPESPQFEPVQCCTSYPVGPPVEAVHDISIVVVPATNVLDRDGAAGGGGR